MKASLHKLLSGILAGVLVLPVVKNRRWARRGRGGEHAFADISCGAFRRATHQFVLSFVIGYQRLISNYSYLWCLRKPA